MASASAQRDSMGVRMGMANQSTHSLPGFLGMWLVMVTAMMSPLLIGPLRHIGARSLPRRRASARALFVVAYAVGWSVAGMLLLLVVDVLDRTGPSALIAISLAVAWQCSPAKQRCLNRQHGYPPLAAFGASADHAAVRFGARQSAWCVGSCWALMLLPLILPSGPPVPMLAVSLWIWAEQLEFPTAASWRIRIPRRPPLLVQAWAAAIRPRILRPRAASRSVPV
jgi:predicted metal-binding membrane protein